MRLHLALNIAAAASLTAFTACKNVSTGGFETDAATGIQYHFFTKHDTGAKPVIGDYAEVLLTMENSNDSVIYDSSHKQRKEDTSVTVKLHLRKTFNGCLPEGIAMMTVGDSAAFGVSADSLYLKTFHSPELPPYIKSGSMVTFHVKLVGFETPQQMSATVDNRIKEREQTMEKRKEDEAAAIIKYLADNNIKVKPESDGIYILERKKGSGRRIKTGDSVEVEYTATLLDGTVAETSDHGPGRTTFTLVYGKDYFIKGFDDIISNLEEGGSVKALIPSALAYGEQQPSGIILPYTPLIYTVEIIKVK